MTDLSFLNSGKEFPPKSEEKRLKTYTENNKLFLTEHKEAWGKTFDRFSSRLKKREIEIDTILNYHQLLSKKITDFICGEPPAISCNEKTDELNQILSENKFDIKLYETIIDVSKLGNGVLKIVGSGLSVVDPQYWFPITSETNKKEIICHVICYPILPDNEGKPTELYVEIHYIGQIEIRHYAFKDGKIENLIKTESHKTEFDDFTIIPLSNITHSGSYYGIDDYQIINSIVEKIMWRLACADKVLDKHTEPSLTGPGSALEYDERTGIWYLPVGNYFKRDTTDDPELKYITWDGNLEANFKEIEMLFEQLYILSEMGTAFLEGGTTGTATSGTALKLKMTSPRIKAGRIVGINSEEVKTAIYLLARVNGLKLERKNITITWKEGLPNDPIEAVNIAISENGGKPLVSHLTSIMKYNEFSEDKAKEELERIMAEDALSVPEILTKGEEFE